MRIIATVHLSLLMLVCCVVGSEAASSKQGHPGAQENASPTVQQTYKADLAFADIPWGSSKAAVMASLQGDRYSKNNDKSDDENLAFSGKINEKEADILFMFYNDKLVKTSIRIHSRVNNARDVYADLKSHLTSVYGAPAEHKEVYKKNKFATNDFEVAVSMGDYAWSSTWVRKVSTKKNKLILSILKDFNTSLVYQSPAWRSVLMKRKQVTNEDL